MKRLSIAWIASIASIASLAAQDLTGDGLRQALDDDAAAFWVYDDLAAAEALAKQSGKPLLITLRCVP